MHQRSSRLTRKAFAQFGVIFALCLMLAPSAGAEPVVLHNGNQPTEATTDTSKLVSLESTPPPIDEVPTWPTAADPAGPKREPGKTTERAPTLPAGRVPQVQPDATTPLSTEPSIHSVIKEGVRPVYEQLVESGAVEALHNLKTDLGLDKDPWSDQEKAAQPTKGPGQWDTSGAHDPAQPPRTAAQAQLDREMATLMREKLIDQITPWVIGLVVLYVVGYLVKLLYGFVRWKSAKRNERRIARAQRHASRRSRSRPHPSSASAGASLAKVESQETV